MNIEYIKWKLKPKDFILVQTKDNPYLMFMQVNEIGVSCLKCFTVSNEKQIKTEVEYYKIVYLAKINIEVLEEVL